MHWTGNPFLKKEEVVLPEELFFFYSNILPIVLTGRSSINEQVNSMMLETLGK